MGISIKFVAYTLALFHSLPNEVDSRSIPGVVSTVVGSASGVAGMVDGTGTVARLHRPQGIVVSADGMVAYIADTNNHRIRRMNIPPGGGEDGIISTIAGNGEEGSDDGTGSVATFYDPIGIALSPAEDLLYVAEVYTHVIRSVVVASGFVDTVAGQQGVDGAMDGTGTLAQFYSPFGVVTSKLGDALYIADTLNDKIRRMELSS
ncbi:hypothetical protein CYMTET_30579, partial [Cymbomonas tetramitiformis]|eukprot:gene26479-32490_t